MPTPEDLEPLRTDAEQTTKAARAEPGSDERARPPARPKGESTGRQPRPGDTVLYWERGTRDARYPATLQCVFADCVRLWVFRPDAVEMEESVTHGDGPGQWRWRD